VNGDRRWRIVFVIGLFVLMALVAVMLAPQGSGHDHLVDNGDAYLHSWNLWWVHTAVSNLHSPYTTQYNGYPRTIDLTFHQLILPLGFISTPFFWMGLSAGQVLVFWQYAFAVVGFVGMFLLVKRVGGPPLGAMVSSVYFVLTPIFWQNLPRPDSLTYTLFPWIVLSILWASDAECRREWWGLPVLLASVVLLMSPYFGVSLVLLWGLVLPFVDRVDISRTPYLLLLPATLLLTSFHWGRQLLAERPSLVGPEVINAFSADLTAWFLPPEVLWWIPEQAARWTETWSGTEPSLYLGWFALGIITMGAHRVVDRLRTPIFIVLIVFFVLSLGPSLSVLGVSWGYLPYAGVIHLVESLRALRAPIRFGYVVIFVLSVVLGTVFPEEGGKWSWFACVLVVLEMARVPVGVTPLPDHETLQSVARQVEEPAVVGVPATDWPSEVQYGQTIHGKKMPVIGLSYGTPELWSRVASNPVLNAFYRVDPLPDAGWSTLEEQGFGGVLIHHRSIAPRHHEQVRDWKNDLRSRFGPPTMQGERMTYYEFSRQGNGYSDRRSIE
jgi:hypothetical protein